MSRAPVEPGPGPSGVWIQWLSTELAAHEIGGVTPRWVRMQIEAGRLRARVLLTGQRATYRISRGDLNLFLARYVVNDARGRNQFEGL